MPELYNVTDGRSARSALRRNATPAEKVLWESLRDRRILGAKFRRQHGIGRYIVDFCCRDLMLVVEADGRIHETSEQYAYDRVRDEYMTSIGFKVIRVSNDDIFLRLDAVLATIEAAITSR